MQGEDYIQANRQAWNETEAFHRKVSFEKLLEEFQKPGFNVFGSICCKNP